MIVDMAKPAVFNIGATGLERLAQQIRTLLGTRKGSVPLDRDFGINWQYVDTPMPEAIQYIIAEIGTQLEKYIPAIKVKQVTFTSSDPVDGNLIPAVSVEIRRQYLSEYEVEA